MNCPHSPRRCVHVHGWSQARWCWACQADWWAYRSLLSQSLPEHLARECYEDDSSRETGVPVQSSPPCPAPGSHQMMLSWSDEPADELQIRSALSRAASGRCWGLDDLSPSDN